MCTKEHCSRYYNTNMLFFLNDGRTVWLREHTTLKESEIVEAESKTNDFEFFQNAMVNLFPSKFTHNLVEPRNLRHVLLDLLELVKKSVIVKFPFVICKTRLH